MSHRLSEIFCELGISQHLDGFIDQGFDTWEAIQDITESDLDALGVKLGHRRKLQRRIANARGIPSNAVLASPPKRSVEDIRSEANKPDVAASSATDGRELGAVVVQKRKYRRHPKPDENAPERPPSAYVLFSNKMRDDLKGQNLTFTEIAKLVGENWQGLTQAEKEPYERQAQAAKEKYNHDLAEYKQTPGYKKYLQYLQDFKAKHATSHADKDGAKRMRVAGSSAAKSNGSSTHQDRTERGSFGEANTGEPSARRQRIGSIVSNGESFYAPSVLSGSMRTPTEEPTSATSPNAEYFDRHELSPGFSTSARDNSTPATLALRRELSYLNGPEGPAPPRNLPSLQDMFDGRQMPNSANYPNDQPPPSQIAGLLPRGYQTISPAPTPGTGSSSDAGGPPSLKHEPSSNGSTSSGSSHSSYPRTPVEGPLPIHALLTNGKPDLAYATNPAIYRSMSPDDRAAMCAQYPSERALGDSIPAAGPPMSHVNGYYPGHPAVPPHLPNGPAARPYFAYNSDHRQAPRPPAAAAQPSTSALPTPRPGGKPDVGLDGISALLQADRIVDQRPPFYGDRSEPR